MLGSFMDDIGITADQFEAACRLSARDLAGLPAHFHRRLFEQIWAANDYEMFVKMMTHKNVELQLQVCYMFIYTYLVISFESFVYQNRLLLTWPLVGKCIYILFVYGIALSGYAFIQFRYLCKTNHGCVFYVCNVYLP